MPPRNISANHFKRGKESSLSEPLLNPNGLGQDECSSFRVGVETDIERPASSTALSISSDTRRNWTSRNTTVILSYTFLVFAGRSIWNQNVLANFIFLIRDGDPKQIGFLTGAMGISQLLVSFPAGYLADKYRRDTILQGSSVIGVLAVATSLVALYSISYKILVVSLCVWGLYWGCAQTSVMALFADSIPDGQRSHYFTKRSILIKMGQLVGPAVAFVMFLLLGDKWTIDECAVVMSVGQILCLPAIVLLCIVNDDEPIQNHISGQSGEDEGETLDSADEESLGTANDSLALTEPLLHSGSDVTAHSATSSVQGTLSDRVNNTSRMDQHQDETYDQNRLSVLVPFVSEDRIIPTLVAMADVTSGLASGMSIRYFAIFLSDNLQMSPVKVQLLYLIAPLVQVVLMKLIQYLAKIWGRCLMAVAFKWIGISLMVAMVFSYQLEFSVWVTATILILRTGFMNSPSALTRSVLMDHVPKEERAKWSALESVNMFSWSGSAVLGGLLVDKMGIIFNFCATAFLQFLATLPLLLLSFYTLDSTNPDETHETPDSSTRGSVATS